MMAGERLDVFLSGVVGLDCDGMLDALMRSPSGHAPWWAGVSISEDGLACLARSKHPDARRLLIVGRGTGRREQLLEDVEGTVAWMRRWLLRMETSPSGALEAWDFWSLFDALPDARQNELLPSLRRVASTEFVDRWEQRGWRHEALERLGRLGDAESVPIMRSALGESRNVWLQVAGATALGEMGPAARAASEDLERVASEHWSLEARAVAGRAAKQVLGGMPPELEPRSFIPPSDPGSPEIYVPMLGGSGSGRYRRYEPASVVVDGERIEFEPQRRPVGALPAELASFDLAAAVPDAPGIRSWRKRLTAIERVGRGWVLGTDMGEFGGGAWFVTRDGRARTLLSRNIVGTVEFAGVRYLLEGLGHMGSEGAILKMQETAGGVELRRMVELPAAPYDVAIVGDHLLHATRAGVAVVSTSFEIELLPYATRRRPPSELPSGYGAEVLAAVEGDEVEVQRCLAPLDGITDRCSARTIPAGVSLWFDVNAAGTVTAVVPFEGRDEAYRRPPTPEVAACIEAVATSWTLPALDSGWTTFGLTLEPD